MTAPMPPLTFSKPHPCQLYLPDLAAMNGMQAEAGQVRTCPVDGIKWVTGRSVIRGGPPTAVWLLATLTGQVAALSDQVTALAGRKVQPRQAVAPVIALAVNGSVDITATWDTAFPDTTYLYDVLIPAVLLGKVTVTEKSRTATAVVVTVKATAATLVASTLNLIAARWA